MSAPNPMHPHSAKSRTRNRLNRLPSLPATAFLALSVAAIALAPRTGGTAGKDRASLPPYHSPNPISEPKLVGEGWIDTGDYESHPAFMPDGHTLYFVKSTPNFSFWTIVYSRFVDGGWTIPKIAPFSGKFADADPFITADGSKLYYISNRPAEDYIGAEPVDDMNIWVMERITDTTWSTPKNVGTSVNSKSNEWFPTLASDGTIYFGSERPGGKGRSDLWRCRLQNGTYGAAENLGDSINTAANEFEPLIAPDQSWMVFMAGGRPDSRGGTDLYVTEARGSGWTPPRNLSDVINSKRNEYSPTLSPDGEYFFWTSCRSFADQPIEYQLSYPELLNFLRRPKNGLGDIYQIDRTALGLKR